MRLVPITAGDIGQAIPEISNLGSLRGYGQKVVASCDISGVKYALKLILVEGGPSPDSVSEVEHEEVEEQVARAKREVGILGDCDSPHLVKLGPVALSHTIVGGFKAIYWTEEWIDGPDLERILNQNGPLPLEQVRKLGMQITAAVQILWSLNKVHRDIKPLNVMQRASGDFVLIDPGIAFDLGDVSLTSVAGATPGTLYYCSPEQTVWAKKRLMDFRSDLFSLGIVVYRAATGRHPFATRGMPDAEVVRRICEAVPERPSISRTDISPDLESVIMRLLAKRPYERYGSCQRALKAFEAIPV